jgi:ribosomal protein S18 acetylase RimI-like enzyme
MGWRLTRADGAGTGRRLAEGAVQEARDRGVRKLSLHVLGSNASARKLYEACGFVVEGVLRAEFLLDGRFVDDVFMARQLYPRSSAAPSRSSRS